ncbi:MAG: hypothetical protein IBJ09_10355 [Bacteroidia bacterium]|nr:hypothetical protein [Bacteroidia bacterium]
MTKNLFLLCLLFAMTLLGACTKTKKGVVEHRRIYGLPNGVTEVSYNALLPAGQVIPLPQNQVHSIPGTAYVIHQFIYLPDKSLKDLGYTVDDSLRSYLGRDWHTYVSPEGAGKKGKNSYWN